MEKRVRSPAGGGAPKTWLDTASQSSEFDENWCRRRGFMQRGRISWPRAHRPPIFADVRALRGSNMSVFLHDPLQDFGLIFPTSPSTS